MIKSIIFIAAYLLLIPIWAKALPNNDKPVSKQLFVPGQNSDPLFSNKIEANAIPQPQVVIYTASYCSHCKEAKKLLTKEGIKFDEIDVTDLAARRDMMSKAGGSPKVPQIFINKQHFGGYSNLKKIIDDPYHVIFNDFKTRQFFINHRNRRYNDIDRRNDDIKCRDDDINRQYEEAEKRIIDFQRAIHIQRNIQSNIQRNIQNDLKQQSNDE